MSRRDFPFSCMNQHLKLQQINEKKEKDSREEQMMHRKDRNFLKRKER